MWWSSTQALDTSVDCHKEIAFLRALDAGAKAFCSFRGRIDQIFASVKQLWNSPGKKEKDDENMRRMGLELLGFFEGVEGITIDRTSSGPLELHQWEMFSMFVLVLFTLSTDQVVKNFDHVPGLIHVVRCTTPCNEAVLQHIRYIDPFHRQAGVSCAIFGDGALPSGTPCEATAAVGTPDSPCCSSHTANLEQIVLAMFEKARKE